MRGKLRNDTGIRDRVDCFKTAPHERVLLTKHFHHFFDQRPTTENGALYRRPLRREFMQQSVHAAGLGHDDRHRRQIPRPIVIVHGSFAGAGAASVSCTRAPL